jgi:hypothetical protein
LSHDRAESHSTPALRCAVSRRPAHPGLHRAPPRTTHADESAEPLRAQALTAVDLASRVDVLRRLFGSAVILADAPASGAAIDASVRIGRFDESALRLFTPVSGAWTLDAGRATGKALGVSQLLCLVPWRTHKLAVRTRMDATGVCELNLYDPAADRLTGSDGVGRAHFGRMREAADTDWFDVSTRDRREPPCWGLRFPAGLQNVRLVLEGNAVTGTVRVDDVDRTLTRILDPADPPAVAYVGVAGGVLNTVAVESLEIDGQIDLAAPTTTVLTGRGAAFWGDGRDVALLYNAGGSVRRLLINGVAVGEPAASTRWTDQERTLIRAVVRLRHGDVIGIELADADDETALLLVGQDTATGRILFATHPLVWQLAPDDYDEAWFRDAKQPYDRPRAGSGGYREQLAELSARLSAPYPGVTVAGPPEPRARVAFRYVVR